MDAIKSIIAEIEADIVGVPVEFPGLAEIKEKYRNGIRRIEVIQKIREMTGLSLMLAKTMTEQWDNEKEKCTIHGIRCADGNCGDFVTKEIDSYTKSSDGEMKIECRDTAEGIPIIKNCQGEFPFCGFCARYTAKDPRDSGIPPFKKTL